MKNSKNIVIILLLITISVMAVGYASFATQIVFNGTAEIVGKWDVKITEVVAEYVSEGCDASNLSFTNTSVTFDAKLAKPGDHITYRVTITNAGTIDAILNNITFTPEEDGSPAIIYMTSDLPPTLNAGETVTLLIHVRYDENTTEEPEIKTRTITGIIEYIQKNDKN